MALAGRWSVGLVGFALALLALIWRIFDIVDMERETQAAVSLGHASDH
jgi:hypothetical protein